MRPNTILDVGMGHGKWGVLCHEYLRYWCGIEPEVDGVEVFREYESPAHAVYREIFYDNVVNLLDKVGNYDLVLAVDVIEHLSRDDGLRFIDSIEKHYIISTPNYWLPQEACFGNEHERHVSVWRAEDFANYTLVPDRVGRSHIVGWR